MNNSSPSHLLVFLFYKTCGQLTSSGRLASLENYGLFTLEIQKTD